MSEQISPLLGFFLRKLMSDILVFLCSPSFSILAPNCIDSQGNTRQIGEIWKEGIFSTCSCTDPMQVQCSSVVISPPIISSCTDNQRNAREPGDVWLEDPTTNCTCTSNNFLECKRLSEPVCLDVRGQFRKNFETWLNGPCVECACVSGSINCAKYDVIITPGLYNVDVSPTCQLCDIRLQTALSSNACIGG